MQDHDVVISLVPWQLHPIVAQVCIDNGVNMVTTSYVSDAMQDMHDDALAAGITSKPRTQPHAATSTRARVCTRTRTHTYTHTHTQCARSPSEHPQQCHNRLCPVGLVHKPLVRGPCVTLTHTHTPLAALSLFPAPLSCLMLFLKEFLLSVHSSRARSLSL